MPLYLPITWEMSAPGDQNCWLLNRLYDETDAQEEQCRRQGVGSRSSAGDAKRDVRNEVFYTSGTVAELIDRTPVDRVSKVILRRTVKVGDGE